MMMVKHGQVWLLLTLWSRFLSHVQHTKLLFLVRRHLCWEILNMSWTPQSPPLSGRSGHPPATLQHRPTRTHARRSAGSQNGGLVSDLWETQIILPAIESRSGTWTWILTWEQKRHVLTSLSRAAESSLLELWCSHWLTELRAFTLSWWSPL